jgi:prepilin-type N-terminal cleavage/methylation domain-containing protein
MEAEMAGKTRKREEMLEGDMDAGFTLVEAMVALIIMSVLFLISVSAIGAIREKSASEAVVSTFEAIASEARSRSIGEGVYFGIVVFIEAGERVSARLYRDGDYDGIDSEDIRKGIDKAVSMPESLINEASKIALPTGITKDPSGKPLNGQDAIRFGRSDILSFSPKATATPGTLYIQEGSGDDGWAIRVTGIDGRIRIYRLKNDTWSEAARW